MRRRRGLALAVALACASGSARAENETDRPPAWDPGHRTTSRLRDEPKGDAAPVERDGVYGRFDGLVDIGLAAGAELGPGGARLATRATAHYFATAGLAVGYSDALGDDGPPAARTLTLGVDLRPTFVPRWSRDMQGEGALLDLFVDSIALGLGAYLAAPRAGAFGRRHGLELSLGAGIPLTGKAEGPWVGGRGLLRWDDPGHGARTGADAFWQLTLSWHWLAG